MRLAGELQHAQSKAYALAGAALLHQYRREAEEVRQYSEAVIKLAMEQELKLWLAWGVILRGWAFVALGQVAQGLEGILRSLSATQGADAEIWQPYILCLLAEGYGQAGKPEQGLAAIAKAFDLVEKNGERYWEADLYRVRGELLQMQGACASEVEACFRGALKRAREQGAKSLELRAAMSLYSMARSASDRADTRALLAETLAWFTEGFDTPDLQRAKSLLAGHD
jgi:adenylate cyclase